MRLTAGIIMLGLYIANMAVALPSGDKTPLVTRGLVPPTYAVGSVDLMGFKVCSKDDQCESPSRCISSRCRRECMTNGKPPCGDRQWCARSTDQPNRYCFSWPECCLHTIVKEPGTRNNCTQWNSYLPYMNSGYEARLRCELGPPNLERP